MYAVYNLLILAFFIWHNSLEIHPVISIVCFFFIAEYYPMECCLMSFYYMDFKPMHLVPYIMGLELVKT